VSKAEAGEVVKGEEAEVRVKALEQKHGVEAAAANATLKAVEAALKGAEKALQVCMFPECSNVHSTFPECCLNVP
jgi:hypothetical protein